jgi:SAM-dependent methyltransferase
MENSGFLHRYFLENSSKRMHKWTHYFDIYERHFSRFRGLSPVILEIGVFGGGSLAMWKHYFGAGASVIGLDILPECKAHEEEGVEVFIGSQDDGNVIDEILHHYPRIDIVLDDGSHQMHHMLRTFELLYSCMSPHGVYMVEDTHTCYWDEFGGGLGREGTFLEGAKRLIDDINAVHSRGEVPVSSFTRSTDSITFYDSVVVFERKPQGSRQAPVTEPM